MSAQYFIPTLADGQGYALLDGNRVVSTHKTINEAIKAREVLEREAATGRPERA